MARIRSPFRALGVTLLALATAAGGALAASPAPSPAGSPSPAASSATSPVPSVAAEPGPGVVRIFTSGTVADTGGTWQITAPRLAGPVDPAVLDAVNSTIDGVIQKSLAAFEASSTVPPAGFDGTDGYQLDHTVALLTPALLSVRLLVSQYAAGAAHPFAVEIPLTFDLATGERIALADLFLPGADVLGRLARVARQELRRQLPLRDAPREEIRHGTRPLPRNYTGWALTADGLEITFGEYQVGPYAIGMPVVVVPWARLADLVDPAGPLAPLLPVTGLPSPSPAPSGSPVPSGSPAPAG